MTRKVFVDEDDFWAATLPFRNAQQSFSLMDPFNNFFNFIGEKIEYYPNEAPPFYQMSEAAYEKVKILLGPNGNTIAKIWLIKRGSA